MTGVQTCALPIFTNPDLLRSLVRPHAQVTAGVPTRIAYDHERRVSDNRSTNDGRTNGGGLVVGGGAVRTTFERNQVDVGPRTPGAGSDGPYGVHVVLDGAVNVDTVFRDNRIATTGGVPLLVVPQPALQPGLLFEGNAWDAGGAATTIAWGASTYASVEAWTAATGQGP